MPLSALMAWDVRDRELAVALLVMEEQTSRYGHDLAEVTDPRREGEFEVRTMVDLEQAAVEDWQARNPKPGSGVRPYVVHLGSSAEDHLNEAERDGDGDDSGGYADPV